MRNIPTATFAVLLAATALAGCNRGGGTPKGQVVATVNGEDITTHELNSELALARPPADVPRKTVEQVVLARVVERKLLADVARDRKLDKNPDFILAERRGTEGLLVQSLQQDIVRKVPPPTREAAEKYIEAHPDQFAQRKIYTIDQVQFLRPGNLTTLGLEKANTMAEVVQILGTNKIEFRRAPTQFDALTLPPALIADIGKLMARNPKELFMFADQPQGAPAPIMYVNAVTDTKLSPFTGEPAINLAMQIVKRDATQAALVASLKQFRTASKDKIKYAAGYGPPPAPSATKAAVPAPAGAAPAPAAAPAG